MRTRVFFFKLFCLFATEVTKSCLDWLCKEARSIPNSKSMSSSAQYWNHSLQSSPRCFAYAIATKFLPHAMWDMTVGICFANIEQIFWGYITPGSMPASKSCHIRLQGTADTIWVPAILLLDSCPQAILKCHHPRAWITVPPQMLSYR